MNEQPRSFFGHQWRGSRAGNDQESLFPDAPLQLRYQPVSGTPPGALPRRGSDFSGPQIAVLFAVLLLLACIPIITHPLPPLEDYVNHLARMDVIATINHDPNLARYYEIDWQIVPNLMMDLIVPVLARFMTVYVAGQVYTIMAFGLIMSGTLALNRAIFGRWSVLPMIAFPLLYNYVFLVGVMNYTFGIGLALWALASWVGLREWRWMWRYTAAAVFVIVLFFCHLSALGFYGVGLLAFESLRLWTARAVPWRQRVGEFFAAGLPFLPVIPLMMMSPTLQLSGDWGWEPRGKIDGIIYIIQVYSDIVAFAITAILGAGVAWAVRHRQMSVHMFGWVVLLVGAIVYLALPRTLFATYMADQRLPIALAFMVIAAINLNLRHRLVRRAFLAILIAVLTIRVIEVDVTWASLSPMQLEFRNSVKRIARGSSVIIASASQTGGDDLGDLGLVHAGCLAMIERSALVTRAFTVRGKQIMHVTKPYRGRVDTEDGTTPTIGQLILAAVRADPDSTEYWRDWRNQFDYVYVLFTDDDYENPAPDLLTSVYDGGRFQLYKVKKAAGAKAGPAGSTPDPATPAQPAPGQPAPAAPRAAPAAPPAKL